MPPTHSCRQFESHWIVAAQKWFDGTRLFETPVRLLISGDRIGQIGGPELDETTFKIVDLDPEAILCPGFIDTHSHSDFSIPDDPRSVAAIMQGITTQVVGQCGFSAAPLKPLDDGALETPIAPDDPTAVPMSEPPRWASFSQYRQHLQERAPAINVVPFVGHNSLLRAANSADRDTVARLADQAVAEGARGISTGLSYQVGRQATDRDVSRLLSIASRHGVPYHTHMRYSEEETLDTLESTLSLLTGQCGIATISHVFPRLRDRASNVDDLVAAIDRHASDFDSLTFDVTVYDSGGTPWTHGLPKWAIGSDFTRLEFLVSDPRWRQRVVDHLAHDAEGWVVDWERLVITKVTRSASRPLLGRTLGELADGAGLPPEEYAVDLLSQDGHFWVSPPNKRWPEVLQLIQSDRCIPMVDGMTVDPRRPSCVVALDRSWNAFRRFLNRVVPEAPMRLEVALRKLTSDGANRLGMVDRGVIAKGAFADLVAVNPTRLNELTPPEYELRSSGIDAVMVNGQWVLDPQQTLTEARPGRVL